MTVANTAQLGPSKGVVLAPKLVEPMPDSGIVRQGYGLLERLSDRVYRASADDIPDIPDIVILKGQLGMGESDDQVPHPSQLLQYEHAVLCTLQYDNPILFDDGVPGTCQTLAYIPDGEMDWLVLTDHGDSLASLVQDTEGAGKSLYRAATTLAALHRIGIVHGKVHQNHISADGTLLGLGSAYHPGVIMRFLNSDLRYQGHQTTAQGTINAATSSQDVYAFAATVAMVLGDPIGDFSDISRIVNAVGVNPANMHYMDEIRDAFGNYFSPDSD